MSNDLRKSVADTRRRRLENSGGPIPSFVSGDVAPGSIREQEQPAEPEPAQNEATEDKSDD